MASMPRVEPPFCSCCGDPVAGDIEHNYLCYACSRQTPAFDAARSAVRYDGAVGEALRSLKYDHALWLAPDLAKILLACMQAEYSLEEIDLIIPVPLHPVRRRQRGFNQSEVLASELSRQTGIRLRARAVRRVRPTITQTGLTAPQRAANVSGAFQQGLFANVTGRRILLVDDVMTTGATVNACAAALKRGGATSIRVGTVARG
jgi:ComF family protein